MLRTNNEAPRRGRFFCLLFMLLLLIAIRYAFQIDIPRALFTLWIIVIALLGDRNEIFALCVCFIPLHESVDMFYSLAFCIAIIVFKDYKAIRINTSVIIVMTMILWELLHCLGNSLSIVQLLSSIIPLIVLSVFMCTDPSELDYPLIVRSLAYTTLSVAVTMLVKHLYSSGFDFANAMAGLQRLGLQTEESSNVSFVGGLINPNSLGIIGVWSVTGLMQLRTAKQGNFVDMVNACIIMIICALTASRTYLICLALMITLLIFAQKGSLDQKIRFVCMIILLLLTVIVLLLIWFPDTLMYFISRFFVKDITTGRLDLMGIYHEYIVGNPIVFLFGIGLQDFVGRLTQSLMVAQNVPHNSIQELIIAWGLPGVILFAALILTMIVVSRKQGKQQSLINYVPLMIILFKGMAGQMLNSAYTMLAFSYAYLSLCADLSPVRVQRIFTRTQTIPRGSGHNINYLSERTKKR